MTLAASRHSGVHEGFLAHVRAGPVEHRAEAKVILANPLFCREFCPGELDPDAVEAFDRAYQFLHPTTED